MNMLFDIFIRLLMLMSFKETTSLVLFERRNYKTRVQDWQNIQSSTVEIIDWELCGASMNNTVIETFLQREKDG